MEPIVTVGAIPPPVGRQELLRRAILRAVAAGEPPRYGPGAVRWQVLRQRVGGLYAGAAVRAMLDELIQGGELVEAWLERPRPGASAPRHVILARGFAGSLPGEPVQARGRPDVIRATPALRGLVTG